MSGPRFNIGIDGVAQIYADKVGGTQVYITDSPDPKKFNVSYGKGSHIPYTKKKEGSLTFFNTKGSPITYNSGNKPGRSTRLDVYPDGGMWSNKTKFNWKNNPGYLYSPRGIKNGEFTTYIRVHDDLGSHQAYAHKIGGRDEDAIRSLVEFVYPTEGHDNPAVNYNYAHFPYVHAKGVKIFLKPVKLSEKSGWIGVKTIHIVGKGSTKWEMWIDPHPFDKDGKPVNNWNKAAEYIDKGCKEYDNKNLSWACHKDVCRIDGFGNVDFALVSDREIDPEGKQPPKTEGTPLKEDEEEEEEDQESGNSDIEVEEAEEWIRDNPEQTREILEEAPEEEEEEEEERKGPRGGRDCD